MKKSTLTKYAVLGALISGQMVYAQEEKYTADSATRSELTVSRAEILRSEIARRQQLLAQSERLASGIKDLQQQYRLQLAAGEKVKASLAEAEQTCLESCTKVELRKLSQDIHAFSSASVGILAFINIVRAGLAGYTYDNTASERATNSFYRPWKTLTGNLILVNGTLSIGTHFLNNFIDAKDSIPRQKIADARKEFNLHMAELSRINVNIQNNYNEIAAINVALKQTIKIRQFQQTQVQAKVGYE
jgi:hypothetical protein